MFAIIITEKGGNERREVFDKTEINVGRVQGNELMLPKGNVSKHHARLLFRDGRFIVTDLKSTNGTYVNGRKITQATIVREGDKVYIGDFILRLEVPQQTEQQSGGEGPKSSPAIAESPAPVAQAAPPLVERTSNANAGREGVVSHYPLENDPDESSGVQQPQHARAPVPPRLPATTTSQSREQVPVITPASPGPRPTTHSVPAALPGPGDVATLNSPQQAPVRKPFVSNARPPLVRPSSTPIPFGSTDSVRIPAIRVAVATVVGRVGEILDLSSLDHGGPPEESFGARLDRAIREEAPRLRAAGEFSPDVDLDQLIRDAREELLGLGPLEPLLKDEDVLEIHISSFGGVLSVRASGSRRSESPFASEATCRRIIRRLCWQSGTPQNPNDPVVERMLRDGSHLLAIAEPVARESVVATIRKRPLASPSLEDLVRTGVLSRSMATYLGYVTTHRCNILVTSPSAACIEATVGALVNSGASGERIVVIQDEGPSLPWMHPVSTLHVPGPEDASSIVAAACRMRPDRLVAPSLNGPAARQLVEGIVGGTEGVIAGVRAPTLRHAVGRIISLAASSGVGIDAAKELVSLCFEVAVEHARLRDGRTRVLRIAEPAGAQADTVALRDIFVFTVERTATGGAIEGSFHATGTIPRAVEDLAVRGASLDQSIFRR